MMMLDIAFSNSEVMHFSAFHLKERALLAYLLFRKVHSTSQLLLSFRCRIISYAAVLVSYPFSWGLIPFKDCVSGPICI